MPTDNYAAYVDTPDGAVPIKDLSAQEQLQKKAPAIIETASGESILLTDSGDQALQGLNLYGKSEQVTTTGAQLLNYLSIEGSSVSGNATATIDDDGYINISGNGNNSVTRFNISPHIPVGEYTISIDNPIDITFGLTIDNGDYANGIGISIGNTSTSKTTADEVTQLVFSTAGKEEFAYKLKIMLNAGTTALPWEPYTGGAPSPSPDYPQEIVSKAEDGNVEVEVLGWNLFDYEEWVDTPVFHGTGQYVDNGIVLTVTEADCYTNYQPQYTGAQIDVAPGNQYTMSWEHSGAFGMVYIFPENGNYFNANNTDQKCTFTAGENTHYIRFRVGVNNAGETATYKNIMLNPGPEPLPFEPYKPPQTLTVSTPNGLPGIPVTSGGNYTDETGQQWVCDEVDFKRGVYVQRIGKVTFDGDAGEYWYKNLPDNADDYLYYIKLTDKTSGDVLCDKLRNSATIMTTTEIGIFGNNVGYPSTVYINFGTAIGDNNVNSFKAYLQSHPITVLYQLSTPVEIPLAPAELSAYAGLHTNYPTTTVINDEGVYMALNYAADTETYIANNYVDKATYNALEDRVAALEGAAVANV